MKKVIFYYSGSSFFNRTWDYSLSCHPGLLSRFLSDSLTPLLILK